MVCIYERRYFLHAKYPPDSRWDARKKEVFLSFRLNVTFCLFPVARCRFANPVAASFAQDNFAVDKRQKRVFKEQAEKESSRNKRNGIKKGEGFGKLVP